MNEADRPPGAPRNIQEFEVWERLYAAALSAYGRVGCTTDHIAMAAAELADAALAQWRRRFR